MRMFSQLRLLDCHFPSDIASRKLISTGKASEGTTNWFAWRLDEEGESWRAQGGLIRTGLGDMDTSRQLDMCDPPCSDDLEDVCDLTFLYIEHLYSDV